MGRGLALIVPYMFHRFSCSHHTRPVSCCLHIRSHWKNKTDIMLPKKSFIIVAAIACQKAFLINKKIRVKIQAKRIKKIALIYCSYSIVYIVILRRHQKFLGFFCCHYCHQKSMLGHIFFLPSLLLPTSTSSARHWRFCMSI